MEGIPDNNSTEESFVINEAEFPNILVTLGNQPTENSRLIYIKRLAKQKGVSEETFLQGLRKLAKEKIQYPEKVFHYHRTSLEKFNKIVELGGLLSHELIKERMPDISLPSGSSSSNAMLTRDKYDNAGNLWEPGISSHGVGASGSDVTLVFGKRIMDLDNYDSIGRYPTVSNAPLSETCTAVLVNNGEDANKVKSILQQNSLPYIEVLLESDWINKVYS